MLLPSGKPVKENVDPATLNLPDALDKLRVGLFSGYLRFVGEQQSGVILFENGKLIGAYFQLDMDPVRFFDLEALGRIFEMALATKARLDIYRLSPELTLSAHGVLRGEMMYKAQDLQLVDIKSLMAKVKDENLNGCLRIYAGDKTSLIFYEDGAPLGFHHDGSVDIETKADASMSVATLPGAKVDVIKTVGLDQLPMQDLMGADDLVPMWQQIQQQVSTRKKKETSQESRADQERREAELRERLPQILRSIAEKDLGKLGPALIDREFGSYDGEMTRDALWKAVQPLEKAATLIAGPAAVAAMMKDMQQAVQTLLKK